MNRNINFEIVAVLMGVFGLVFVLLPHQLHEMARKKYKDNINTLKKINSKSYIAYLRICGSLFIIGSAMFSWLLYLFATTN
jgi:hypothetical protein